MPVMRAWRFHNLGDMRLDEIPVPSAQPGWVLLKVRVVQPSVTEALLATGTDTAGLERIRLHLESEGPVQLFGHEFCGEVVEVGSGVTRLQAGQRVAPRSNVPCHRCSLCRSGRSYFCGQGPRVGKNIPGALAEYVAAPEDLLAPLPPQVGDSEGACVQPLCECVAGVHSAGLEAGDTVAVIGLGNMGLFTMLACRFAGAGKLIAIDVRDDVLDLSVRYGADYTINSRATDPVEAVKELTDGVGVDVVFEAAGGNPKAGLAGSSTMETAFHLVRAGGKIVGVSIIWGLTPLSLAEYRRKSVKLIFPDFCTLQLLEYTIHLMATGHIDLRPIISHQLHGLEQVPQAFEITGNKTKYNATSPAQVVIA